jgi:DNA-binding HxlR family transcriptional regulator
MYEAVDALTSRIGLGIMRELSSHGPRTATQLMGALGISHRQTLTRTLYRLEEMGVVVADLPLERRRGRAAVYSLVPDQVSEYFRKLESFALSAEPDPTDEPDLLDE